MPHNPSQLTTDQRALLHALASQYPTMEDAISELTALRATLSLPRGVIHVLSDVHGEDIKLRHVINNASGALRQLVDSVVGSELSGEDKAIFLAVLYYPREAINRFSHQIVSEGRRLDWVTSTLTLQFKILRELRSTYRRVRFEELLPPWYRELFIELGSAQRPAYIREMIHALSAYDRDWGAVRAAARLIRNLACEELLVIGDLGDRGPRMDRVCESLMRQPRCNVLWGNHDMLWIGAHLGHDASMLTCLRFSLRYRKLSQLEEGYGVMMAPIERLVREVYADDPAEKFLPKGEGFRDALMVARMQKAITIMQFKAEGKLFERNPSWGLGNRRLLHRIRFAGSGAARRATHVEIDGKEHAMLDGLLPTIDPASPYEYSKEELACVERLREGFTRSMKLREHMEWLVNHGGIYTNRDETLFFHACVPVEKDGTPQSLLVDGKERSGRELMDAFSSVVRRAMRKRWFGLDSDADWIWYLWGGPKSPLFGKDKLATFETSFVADKDAHKEHKNAYFDLMHDAAFIKGLGRMFGVGEDVLVVNGHVPVKVEKGEQPIKKGGNAITIDGAFSEAYGDRGYTLVIRPDRIDLAELTPFKGVERAIEHGDDIVPHMTTVRRFAKPRTVGDTQDGELIRRKIADLDLLVRAYQEGVVRQR
jgi:fructose-1,6-bisphosphatase-3